jgi:Sec-independent protein translocase protein TatA
MFATTRGELAIVVFIFVLVWGAVLLPRLGERVAEGLSRRARKQRNGG